jgi:peptidoglycan/LPS O-acetylase OafA/YrhL
VGETGPASVSLVRVHRPELQGLRAVAVALVVVYHVWFGRVSGGVDVFFVVSGFLLTGQLARAAERGPLELGRRWIRTLVRLLPCAVVVLVATVAAGMLLLPEGRWPQTLREVVAAALFLENWQLAADTVDYAARSNMSSPVQHFWSLSIQGQFFLLWPLLVALVALAARGDAARVRAHLTVAVLGVFAASLTFSVVLTATNQPLAYFHSLTRLWEFALGGLLALTIDTVRLPRRTRIHLGWIGLVGLLACGAVLQVGNIFPGAVALWPTGCAVLVLLAGVTGARGGADRLLTSRPLGYVGDLSYPLYLWHWPVLVFTLVLTGRDRLDLTTGAGVVAVSVVLAVVTHHLVEKPVPRLASGGYRVAVAGLAVVFLASGVWQVEAVHRASGAGEVGDIRYPGALALAAGDPEPAPLLPPPVSVTDDWVRIERWDCVPMTRFPMDACTRPVEAPQRRIVVVGDSHAQQLSGALVPIADRHGWQLTVIARGACPFSTASEVVPDEADCLAWGDAAAAEIADLRPDAVVTLASRDVRAGLTEQTPPGFVARWQQLAQLGIPVLAIRDNPRFDRSMPDCVPSPGVQQPGDDPAAALCGVERAAVYAPEPPWTHLPDVPPDVRFLDIADRVCGPDLCPAVIGNVLVYLDDNHLTASYATSMGPLVEGDVLAALGF